MENMFVTITGQDRYFGMKPFKIGGTVKLVKEPCNISDSEAIRVELPYIDTIGYVANSDFSVYKGTISAGRLYDKIKDEAYARVMFITPTGVVAVVMES